jgi:4-amino-4-deoxy-L-arabinose transferase-like glycosyltransferase
MAKAVLDWLILLFAAVVYFAGLQLDVMDVDSAQYAAISREMADTGEYLQVHNRGNDYLDKPPLLFWVSALSFDLFGVHNWSFKLIPFLFALYSIFAVFKMAKLLFKDRSTAISASAILASCQAYFLFTMDLRTDTLLTACVTIATWQLLAYLDGDQKKKRLVWGFAFIGFAMLAKGPIGLVVPALALGTHLIVNRRWKDIFRVEWLLGLVITALVLAPMSWGLYQQFDLQPDKQVMMPSPNGMQANTNISGLRFYFWEQSFGRITGENVWRDSSGPFFFVHNFLWTFMPWSLLAVAALFWKLTKETKTLFSGRRAEWLTLGGFIIPFIVLSTSKFKLPHYIFPLYPFAALFTAQMLVQWLKVEKKTWQKYLIFSLSGLSIVATVVIGVLILFWIFPSPSIVRWIYLFLFGIVGILIWKRRTYPALLRTLFISSVAFNMVMNMHFYPLLLKYQKGNQLAYIALKEGATKENTVYLKEFTYSFDFYMKSSIPVKGNVESLTENERYIFTNQEGRKMLIESNKSIAKEIPFSGYPITNLSNKFLDPALRESVLNPHFLIILEPEA